jgi:hypothetical protein
MKQRKQECIKERLGQLSPAQENKSDTIAVATQTQKTKEQETEAEKDRHCHDKAIEGGGESRADTEVFFLQCGTRRDRIPYDVRNGRLW